MSEHETVRVLGVDCSLNNLGCCVCEIDEQLNMHVLSTKLFTHDDNSKKYKRKSFEDLKKAEHFAKSLKEMILENTIQIVVGEVPCGSQSSRACTSAGIVTGLLGSMAVFHDFVGVTPLQAKKCATGSNTATKDDIMKWVEDNYPEVKIPKHKVKGEMVVYKNFEHEADSIAIVHSALNTMEFQQFLLQHLGKFR